MPKTRNEEKMLILVFLLLGLSWSRAWPELESSLSKSPKLYLTLLILMEMVIILKEEFLPFFSPRIQMFKNFSIRYIF